MKFDALPVVQATFRRLLLTLLAAPSALLAEEMTAAEVFEAVSDSIVVILGVDVNGQPLIQGSGVVFELTHIATNCHVYREAFRAVVQYRGEEVPAALQYMDADRDVCSFVAPLLTAPPAQIGSTDGLRVGQIVYAIGAPRGMDLTLSDGLISGLRPTSGGQLLQTTAPISPGSSGGGLFDSNGRLIGLTTLQFRDSQQLNFAVPIEWLHELPDRHSQPEVLQAAIEYGRVALNKIEESFIDDPLYQCKRALLLPEVRSIADDIHPADWATAFKSLYDRFDISRCSQPISEGDRKSR